MIDLVFTYQDGSQELYHHGVKGMKWGVRKKREYAPDTKRMEKLSRSLKEATSHYKATKSERAYTRMQAAKKNYDYEKSGKAAKVRHHVSVIASGVTGARAGLYTAQAVGFGLAAASNPIVASTLITAAAVSGAYALGNAALSGYFARTAYKQKK